MTDLEHYRGRGYVYILRCYEGDHHEGWSDKVEDWLYISLEFFPKNSLCALKTPDIRNDRK